MEYFIIFLCLLFIIYLLGNKRKYTKKNSTLKKEYESLEEEFHTYKKNTEALRWEYDNYKKEMEPLRKYESIKDVEQEKERIIEEASEIKKEARESSREAKRKAEKILSDAHSIASKMEENANKRASEIAGEAWTAKQNANQYVATVKAMKNIIKGYGDEYLIPNHSLLDELAEEYDHKEAGAELAKIRTLIKSMIKNGEVADCDYVEAYRKSTAIEFVTDAFNGKVDSIMSKVKHDNYGKLLQSIQDAYRIVNHNGKAFKDARIKPSYYNVILEQLKMAVTVQELKKKDLEEQREIREKMREEEKARRDFEKALREAEKQEKMLAKAMREAEAKLSKAADEERAKFEKELEEIKQKLTEAEEKGQRALSMAQQTKRGHVYIISNIGSFGNDVLKIGLTRRLDPMDRVKELGDASVPFSFDVHAMIFSEDAPQLEKELHDLFTEHRVNKVNHRKEFFYAKLTDIKEKILGSGYETHWTMKAEALEYRESLQLSQKEPSIIEE